MSRSKIDKKNEQLGMSYGKACHRLRKLITFSLIQKLDLDDCFRCGNKIETAEDLSNDHKVDWLDVDPSLFWDVDNIVFSHLRCNCMYRRKVVKTHCIHGHEFSAENTRIDSKGYRSCRECGRIRWHGKGLAEARRWRRHNRTAYNKRMKSYMRKYRARDK